MSENGQNTPHANECRERPSASYEAALRIIAKETRGYPTGYLRASSGTIQHGPESREVGYETAKPLGGLWIWLVPAVPPRSHRCTKARLRYPVPHPLVRSFALFIACCSGADPVLARHSYANRATRGATRGRTVVQLARHEQPPGQPSPPPEQPSPGPQHAPPAGRGRGRGRGRGPSNAGRSEDEAPHSRPIPPGTCTAGAVLSAEQRVEVSDVIPCLSLGTCSRHGTRRPHRPNPTHPHPGTTGSAVCCGVYARRPRAFLRRHDPEGLTEDAAWLHARQVRKHGELADRPCSIRFCSSEFFGRCSPLMQRPNDQVNGRSVDEYHECTADAMREVVAIFS